MNLKDRDWTNWLKGLDRPVAVDPAAIVERVAARRADRRTARRRLATVASLLVVVAAAGTWVLLAGDGAAAGRPESWSVARGGDVPGRIGWQIRPAAVDRWPQLEQLVRNQKLRRALHREAEQIRRDTHNQQFLLTREIISRGDLLEDEFSMAFSF